MPPGKIVRILIAQGPAHVPDAPVIAVGVSTDNIRYGVAMLVYLVRFYLHLSQLYCSVAHSDGQWLHLVFDGDMLALEAQHAELQRIACFCLYTECSVTAATGISTHLVTWDKSLYDNRRQSAAFVIGHLSGDDGLGVKGYWK